MMKSQLIARPDLRACRFVSERPGLGRRFSASRRAPVSPAGKPTRKPARRPIAAMTKNPKGRAGGLAVYVTSHGFGHMHRTAAVLNRIPAEVPVVIRSSPDLFEHWRERLFRPAELERYVWDAGAVNPAGDSAATDGAATLEQAAKAYSAAMAHVDEEARFLQRREIAAVLCDAPAVPLVAASLAEVPRFLMTNFTWADIYAPHARKLGRDAPALGQRPSPRVSPCDGRLPDRAGFADVMALKREERGDGCQSGARPACRAAPQARFGEDRPACVSIHRPLWPERSGVVAPRTVCR